MPTKEQCNLCSRKGDMTCHEAQGGLSFDGIPCESFMEKKAEAQSIPEQTEGKGPSTMRDKLIRLWIIAGAVGMAVVAFLIMADLLDKTHPLVLILAIAPVMLGGVVFIGSYIIDILKLILYFFILLLPWFSSVFRRIFRR